MNKPISVPYDPTSSGLTLPNPTKHLSERLDRIELESSIADYLTTYIGMTEDGAKNFAENTIDSWYLYLKKGDTPNGCNT